MQLRRPITLPHGALYLQAAVYIFSWKNQEIWDRAIPWYHAISLLEGTSTI